MKETDFEFSKHILERIEERKLNKQWVVDTITSPDFKIVKSESEIHFFKRNVDFADRSLKVVFNPLKKMVVTAHFDRKMTKNN